MSIFSNICNGSTKAFAKWLLPLWILMSAAGCFWEESSEYEVESANNQNVKNSQPVLNEINTISVRKYWFGLSLVHSVDDRVSIIKIQRLSNRLVSLENDNSLPFVIIVVGNKQAPHAITGFELYLPNAEEYGWKVNKRTDESTGAYEISFFKGDENKKNPRIDFNLEIRRCNEKFCAQLTN